MTVILKNHKNGKEREFDDKDEAKDTRNELIGIGAKPEDLEIIENGSEDTTDSEAQEGGQNESEQNTGDDTNGSKKATVVTETPEKQPADSLPDRELTDDPIEWLQKGDGELTTDIKGTTVITKKGFRVLQHKYDISTGSDVIVGPEETGHEFCRVKAWAEMPDGRRAEAHASAHVDRGDDHFLLVSMADTRAKSRALSDVSGVGAVALEEMIGVDTDD